MPLFRALAKNMAPMTNADESPTNRLTLFPIYLSLFIVSTLWLWCPRLLFVVCFLYNLKKQRLDAAFDMFWLHLRQTLSNFPYLPMLLSSLLNEVIKLKLTYCFA